jgi:hypothetical protein
LGNFVFTIDVTETCFPLTVKFDACLVLLCGEPQGQGQLQAKMIYMCSYPGPSEDYHGDFHKNLDGPCGAGQMWGGMHSIRVGPYQTMGRKSGNNYKERSKLVELFLPNCQLYQCNPLLLVIDDPHIMTIEPSNLRQTLLK